MTYNPGPILFSCLESLKLALSQIDAEVIIVDNASGDGTVEQVRQNFPEVKIIANPANRGFAAANNQGLAVASGDYLLLNPDVVLHPNSLSSMMQFIEGHSEVGICGPRMYDEQGHVALTAYPTYEPKMILWQYLGLDRVLPYTVYGRYRRQCETATEPFSVETLQGSCFMIRRKVYQQIGGLDESFFLFCEEPDYCERARAKGWKVCYVPTAQITHYESSTVSRYTAARVRSYHRCPIVYFRKRQRPASVLVLQLGFTLEIVGKLIIRLSQVALGQNQFAEHVRTYMTVLKEIWTA